RELLPAPLVREIRQVCRAHLDELYTFYGVETGVKIARKHIGWYTRGLAGSAAFRHAMNQITEPAAQSAAVDGFFSRQAEAGNRLHYCETNETGTPRELAA
ncbi:MAG: tRNA-dihydrouridine synthase, partial [Azoarcus sp.]|nr:tRNA-dihydrouridine synthase [Azoarcus sp.]